LKVGLSQVPGFDKKPLLQNSVNVDAPFHRIRRTIQIHVPAHGELATQDCAESSALVSVNLSQMCLQKAINGPNFAINNRSVLCPNGDDASSVTHIFGEFQPWKETNGTGASIRPLFATERITKRPLYCPLLDRTLQKSNLKTYAGFPVQ
jgi:hypothetical protein